MTGQFQFQLVDPQGERTVFLERITTENPGIRSLGRAYGIDIGHCIHLAIRYSKNFIERVKSYRIIDDDKQLEEIRKVQSGTIAIEFYEDDIDHP